MISKKTLTIISVLIFIVVSFFAGREVGHLNAKKMYDANLVTMDNKYKETVVSIRKAHKEAVSNLKKYYYDRLKDVETSCPKEDICFFDHDMISFWAEMYNKHNFIFIPKNVFNNPATHFSEEDFDRLDGALDKLEKE